MGKYSKNNYYKVVIPKQMLQSSYIKKKNCYKVLILKQMLENGYIK